MKLAFVPGQLFLEGSAGEYIVTLRGEEVLRTATERKAVAKFNQIREVLAKEFPPDAPSPEQMRAILLKEIGLGLVEENKFAQLEANRRKRTHSRTFG